MSLEEKTFVDMICYRPEFGSTEVRWATVVYRDGAEISRMYQRHVVDADQEDITQEDELVQRIIQSVADHRSIRAAEMAELREAQLKAMTGGTDAGPTGE